MIVFVQLKLGDTIEVISNDTLTLSADNEMNIGKIVTEYVGSSGMLVVETRETKSIHLKAKELLSIVIPNKEMTIEFDEELVLNSFDTTNCEGTDKVSYPIIVRDNDLSALDAPELEPEPEAEESKGGFWNNFGKIAVIALARSLATGIIAGGDFVIDVASQLMSNGFDVGELKWDDAVLNAGLGIVICEGVGYVSNLLGRILRILK